MKNISAGRGGVEARDSFSAETDREARVFSGGGGKNPKMGKAGTAGGEAHRKRHEQATERTGERTARRPPRPRAGGRGGAGLVGRTRREPRTAGERLWLRFAVGGADTSLKPPPDPLHFPALPPPPPPPPPPPALLRTLRKAKAADGGGAGGSLRHLLRRLGGPADAEDEENPPGDPAHASAGSVDDGTSYRNVMRHMDAQREHNPSLGDGGLRAAVFGMNDGLLTSVGLVLGVYASGGAVATLWKAGLSGLVAGASSMAVGEWISMQVSARLMLAGRSGSGQGAKLLGAAG